MAYTFDFINVDGSIDHFELGLFCSDDEALRQAKSALLASMTAGSVEVWRDEHRIGRIQDPNGRASRRPQHPTRLDTARSVA